MTTASLFASSSLLLALVATGCVEERPDPLRGPTSLAVTITAPEDLGSVDSRLPDGERQITVHVQALDSHGKPATGVNAQAEVFVQFLGTLSPDPSDLGSLGVIQLTDGVGENTFTLDVAYGRTQLWVEDPATLITGVSPDIWFRDPYLDDVNRPANEMSLSALSVGPLEGKQVEITSSRHGSDGALVVTGIYAQGYTVSDVKLSDRSTVPYGHALIFTFGRPRAIDGTELAVGNLVKKVSGGVKDFNGLTEFNFPTTEIDSPTPDLTLVPEPAVIDPAWLDVPLGASGMINLERLESGLVAVEGGILCPFDDDYDRYGQWKLDVGNGCNSRVFNVITKGQVSDFDPTTLTPGTTIDRVVGTLKAVNIGSFNVWIIQPRTSADITVN